MRKVLLPSIVLLICSVWSPLKAQNDITNIFKAGLADLNTVAEGYLKPAGNAFAAGMGSNWYNTAETHKVLGFEVKIGVNAVQAPTADRFFSLTGLTNLKASDPRVTEAPSFVGKGNGVELKLMQPRYLSNGTSPNPLYNGGNGVITSFTTPAGMSQYVPSASVQLTVGLPFKNDLMVRFLPTVKYKGTEASVWGVGVKNNFIKLIPGVKLLPFDASFLVAYNQMDIKYAFSTSAQIRPEALVGPGLGYIPDPNSNDYSTQGIELSSNALTANVIVSKKLLFFTPYVGFGITKTNFDMKVVGNFPTLGDPDTSIPGQPKMRIINKTDPISISSSQMMPGTTVGFRLKLFFAFTANAQYTFQKYPTASVGFGIGIR